MKKNLLLVGSLIAIILSTSAIGANATLILEENCTGKVVYDTQSNLYWIQDINAFTNENYVQQLGNIYNNYANTGYFGINNWHMATLDEIYTLPRDYNSPDLINMLLFNPSHVWTENEAILYAWSGRYDHAGPLPEGLKGTAELDLGLSTSGSINGSQWYIDVFDDGSLKELGAWVVGTSDPTLVPEPSTVLLFGVGLSGIACLRRRSQG